ncbi:ABC transporter substrate-binding protein [Luteipulveratus flavus]|uniref:ABC transporter substrate-binding protein n=1 Tax=Luteipulveratus flavus TaxID=3031728 RepID=A0ABT6C1K4_9MICO|nr:ABC transporter substrate-binding protein [Luteipulveratus sp. YIM 133296]MDF8262758.1 ABC transporter substrate-binding protein [Luteipulveratus sp. YIM 133296]
MSHHPLRTEPGAARPSRRSFLKLTGTLSAAAAITAAVSACSGGPESTGNAGGGGKAASSTIEATLAFALSSGFDPANASSAVATAANQHAFEGLVDLDPVTREPYAALAADLPKAGADGRTWTATLRDGATFSDGTAVTAADVAHSFTRAMDPEMLMSQFIGFIAAVKAKDAKTVEFTLKTPFALFVERVAVIKIVPKAKTGDAAASKAFDTTPVGSGPWKIDSADQSKGLTFSVNPHYNGPRKAKAQKMVWHTTTEAATRVADLESGRSQAIEAVPYINVKQVAGKKKAEPKQAFNQLFLMFNCSAKPFDDKRVRQALHYALDTTSIIQTALQGYGTPADSYLDHGNKAYQKASTVYGFDQAKAKSLLQQAGASSLKFELVTTDAAFVKDIAPLLVDAWKQIGVTATLNTAPSSSVYAPAPDGLVTKSSFRVLAASGDPTVFGVDTDLLLRWFYFGETWPQKRYHWDAASQKKVATWLDQAAAETDEAKQKAIWKQVLDFVADEAPLYPVLHTKIVTGWDDTTLSDFQPASTTGLYFLDTARKA